MLRKISIWPLFFASFLVLGHAIFPHSHQSPDDPNSIAAQFELPIDEGLINILSQLFSQDLGDNHLEDFNQGTENISELVFVAQAFLHTLLYFEAPEDINLGGNTISLVSPLLSCHFTKDAPLRAPPQV